jgi:hypothetical protein
MTNIVDADVEDILILMNTHIHILMNTIMIIIILMITAMNVDADMTTHMNMNVDVDTTTDTIMNADADMTMDTTIITKAADADAADMNSRMKT